MLAKKLESRPIEPEAERPDGRCVAPAWVQKRHFWRRCGNRAAVTVLGLDLCHKHAASRRWFVEHIEACRKDQA